MYKFLFLDLDDTILDFRKAEHIALGKTFTAMGLTPTEAVFSRYSRINRTCWEALERGEMTRPQVLVGRFQRLFREFGIEIDPEACAALYESNLSVGHYFLPGAEEALAALAKKQRLFLASNGTARVQTGRIASAGIAHYFEKIFVSQEIGADKPSKTYFDRCFERIPGFDPAKALIVGDSLTSDIRGGQNAGIAACWVNPGHAPRRTDIRVDYEIEALAQLPALLEEL